MGIKVRDIPIYTKPETMTSEINEYAARKCPECGSTEFINDTKMAELMCAKCGLVLEENIIDQGPEWRAFDSTQLQNRVRTGAPSTNMIHDKGLTTTISNVNRDANGNIIRSKASNWYRIRKTQKRSRIANPRERNLAIALNQLNRCSSILGLPKNVKEEASFIYREAVNKSLIRGRSIDLVVDASIYIACRKFNIPRNLDEIAKASSSNKNAIGKTYRAIARKLNIKLTPTSPADYIPRFSTNLALSNGVEVRAMEIANRVRELGMTSGKDPSGIAAAILYMTSIRFNERKSQEDIAEVAGVSEVTIRNRYRDLLKLESENLL